MTNKLAVITGGSKGTGKAVAISLARQGYDIALIARDLNKLEKVKQEILTSFNVEVDVFSVDVQNHNQVQECIAAIYDKHKKIDILFNNAGVLIPGSTDITPEDLDVLINTNIKGVYNVLHAVVPLMKAQKSGHIFNLSSMAGKRGVKQNGAYSLTKFAVTGISDSLYHELLPHNVKVTALCPSAIATKMTQSFALPQDQMISVSDIVKAVDFVLSLGDNACIQELLIKCKAIDAGSAI